MNKEEIIKRQISTQNDEDNELHLNMLNQFQYLNGSRDFQIQVGLPGDSVKTLVDSVENQIIEKTKLNDTLELQPFKGQILLGIQQDQEQINHLQSSFMSKCFVSRDQQKKSVNGEDDLILEASQQYGNYFYNSSQKPRTTGQIMDNLQNRSQFDKINSYQSQNAYQLQYYGNRSYTKSLEKEIVKANENDKLEQILQKNKDSQNIQQQSNMYNSGDQISTCWYILAVIESNLNYEVTWLTKLGIQNISYYDRYIYSLYWAITTMTTVGYGDITPSNSTEAAFVATSMIIFSCVFAYSINNIGFILQEINKSKQQLNDNLTVVQRYLNRKGVNINTKCRIRHYLKFLAKEQKNRDKQQEDHVLGLLSNKLRKELSEEINTKIINQYPLFSSNFSSKVIKKLVFIMKEVQFSPNEIIFQENEVDDQSIYFLQSGIVEIYSNSAVESQNIILQQLSSKQYFGEISFFSGLARKASARSLNLSTLYKIKREDFIFLLKEFNEDFERFKMIEQQTSIQQNFKCIFLQCYSCKRLGHTIQGCPKLHCCFDKQFKILKYNYSIFQERKPFSRNKKKFQFNKLVLKNKEICSKIKQQIEDFTTQEKIVYSNYTLQTLCQEKEGESSKSFQSDNEESYMNSMSFLGNKISSINNNNYNFQTNYQKNNSSILNNKMSKTNSFKNLSQLQKNNTTNSINSHNSSTSPQNKIPAEKSRLSIFNSCNQQENLIYLDDQRSYICKQNMNGNVQKTANEISQTDLNEINENQINFINFQNESAQDNLKQNIDKWQPIINKNKTDIKISELQNEFSQQEYFCIKDQNLFSVNNKSFIDNCNQSSSQIQNKDQHQSNNKISDNTPINVVSTKYIQKDSPNCTKDILLCQDIQLQKTTSIEKEIHNLSAIEQLENKLNQQKSDVNNNETENIQNLKIQLSNKFTSQQTNFSQFKQQNDIDEQKFGIFLPIDSIKSFSKFFPQNNFQKVINCYNTYCKLQKQKKINHLKSKRRSNVLLIQQDEPCKIYTNKTQQLSNAQNRQYSQLLYGINIQKFTKNSNLANKK